MVQSKYLIVYSTFVTYTLHFSHFTTELKIYHLSLLFIMIIVTIASQIYVCDDWFLFYNENWSILYFLQKESYCSIQNRRNSDSLPYSFTGRRRFTSIAISPLKGAGTNRAPPASPPPPPPQPLHPRVENLAHHPYCVFRCF